jgi:hypothetical protein
MKKGGRRPADGSFPACPKTGVCKAQSVRNQSACRNCALSEISLHGYLAKRGTSTSLFDKIKENCSVCLDLLTRVVDSYQGIQEEPDFEKVVLTIYHTYGNGNVAPRYIGKPIEAPRPGDEAHARMILEELGLTCYTFNANTDKCQYVEDLIYCKRHTPILSINRLNKMCQRFEKNRHRKRKFPSTFNFAEIKNAILEHESHFNTSNHTFKDIPLRKRFNSWLRKLKT